MRCRVGVIVHPEHLFENSPFAVEVLLGALHRERLAGRKEVRLPDGVLVAATWTPVDRPRLVVPCAGTVELPVVDADDGIGPDGLGEVDPGPVMVQAQVDPEAVTPAPIREFRVPGGGYVLRLAVVTDPFGDLSEVLWIVGPESFEEHRPGIVVRKPPENLLRPALDDTHDIIGVDQGVVDGGFRVAAGLPL
ncbi:hypothetical protein ACIBBE_45970 [Streptomyces sp. NPDC051644]|uniref:hypothetical protein n=1 Tax=Streptomyces sp. NPDC051644 TaxID=3365666 RepID=UPI00379F0FCA